MTMDRMQSAISGSEPIRTRAHCLDLISWGVRFRISASCGAILDCMRQYVPFATRECDVPNPDTIVTFSLRPVGARYQIFADDELLMDAATLDSSLRHLRARLTVHIAEYAPDYIFVHAGVVAWRDRALLLPGFSHAGKSTLVAQLVRAGATYYSDEFALLDRDGCVHPYLRTLQIRRPGCPEQKPLALAALNGRAGTAVLTVGLVVFTEFIEGARWAPRAVTRGQGVLEMLRHAVSARRTPARVLSTLTATFRHATVWQSRRGEAPETACALLAALASERRFA